VIRANATAAAKVTRMNDLLFSAAADRNSVPILEVLERVLPDHGQGLEIASGTGQHVVHFARALPGWRWQPSDPKPEQRRSIYARIGQSGLTNILPPLDLDVLQPWAVSPVDAIIVANLLHISPPETLPALMEGAELALRPGGMMHVYGPFKRNGAQTSDSNAEFEASLRSRNRVWGIRDLEKVIQVADKNGLVSREIIDMPANNFSLVFERS
jgi:hypothetical protein